ncbi:MAG TPA: SIS domain-containing protein [Jatrophihabitans sp.]|nr:SIS domain-containing protein [Jatrophihabitans sp.]
MTGYDRAELRHQVTQLAHDVPALAATSDAAWPDALAGRRPRRLLVVGNGDSHCAALAALLAFARAGVAATAATPAELAAHPELAGVAGYDLTVLVSASGGSPVMAAAAGALRELGVPTVALTGRPDSPLGAGCDRTACWSLPGLAPAPGIRTYQANLLLLLGLAARLDTGQGIGGGAGELADAVAGATGAAAGPAGQLADLVTRHPVPAAPMFAGTGPRLGTARYAAAKVIESTGLPAAGHDLDDWWHVQRFSRPVHAPLVLLAGDPAGPVTADRVRATGRPALAWAATGRESRFGPLLDVPVVATAAAELADRLASTPFDLAAAG